ncbi:MAG: Maf family protein [Burkholderiaceae bacterium]
MSAPIIYLASASPRRHDILQQMNVLHRVLRVPAAPGADEPRLENETPECYVRRTARDKATRATEWIIAQSLSQWPVLSADTTVILDRDILGKPADHDDATRMLGRLSGRTHSVHTAIALAHQGRLLEDVSVTAVRMKKLSAVEIDAYCKTVEPLGKAGGYGIQGYAARFIEHISGSYTGVMGLPIFETHRLLLAAGLLQS